jgi:hypothetical protein
MGVTKSGKIFESVTGGYSRVRLVARNSVREGIVNISGNPKAKLARPLSLS